MITINQLLKMPIGERVGGGFTLVVKATKKSVQLPNKRYIHTVILVDETGEMLADFKDPVIGGYSPLGKGNHVHIIVAEIQAADPGSRQKVLATGTKLWVDQWEVEKTIGDPGDNGYAGFDEEMWDAQIKGKIRHGLTCAYISAGQEPDKDEIKKWTEFIITGE